MLTKMNAQLLQKKTNKQTNKNPTNYVVGTVLDHKDVKSMFQLFTRALAMY